ncbi:multiple RNA-binding domain-containing protein 1 [Candida albicans 12C]|uniref:Multiple RNA-binding domain-containing protein 1 n=1 Tax=Candida albicans (strain SC5314 / ATCC MYA-2876) TaxID=237561 RepID=MRD1_CANAL|nr:RNA-binding ribosome biosynthesis protein [Candida albicans SC5314]Q5AJS6.2 RecName: Full=Multiple RNA-binding domain-containing protein 1 [Candida albicans SC5314]AOW28240.1 RNA-binding ribosome biosynthesis protein [Candida albicans SC5314]KGT70219.1 multiple RNA-binding domain-containing protein 1 [Candida albicans 12C]|eukprot:XP_721723.2 RNA-binding ribosome biosynthesis protein [Candida albicans SC5314]
MSRLIVKGLPKYYTEEKLREFFSKQGDVTDVKLMKKRNGESRKFAFIGYKSADAAERAVKYFNKSFIDTARIEVEFAKTFSDPTVPLSFKEKRKREEQKLKDEQERLLEQELRAQAKKQKTKSTSEIDDEIASNPKLREYMEVMKPSHQVKSWANDTIADGSGGPSVQDLENALNGNNESPVDKSNIEVVNTVEDASDDEYNDFKELSNKHGENEDEEEEEEMMSLGDLPTNEENKDKNESGENLAANENISDLEWLKSRSTRIKENGEVPEIVPEVKEVNEVTEATQQSDNEPEMTPEEQIAHKIEETGRLFIRNISYEASEEDFRSLFSQYGALEEVHIAIDTRTGKSKGFLYVQFLKKEDATRAYRSLDKQIFQGRLLHILPADKKKDHRLDEFDLKNLPLKKQRELKKKAQAAKTQFSWNSLYMNSDAVLESVASKLGVTKSQLIDPENSSSAVKQALAEAHVIGDVRKYFEDRGVDLTSFDKKERDDKIILVKNFPFGTTIDEIGELFSAYGQLKRMLMPPAGTIAIIEFRDAPSARAAFSKLAYKRFKSSILYLEKGPKDLFTREPTTNEVATIPEQQQNEHAVEAKISANEILGESKEDDEIESVQGPTVAVFVKNLNFATTVQALSDLFKPLPGFVVATVKTKPDPKNSGKTLSMGFGFVEFRTKEQANVAISTLDGHVLDGHKLQLKLSHKQGTGTSASSIKKSGKSSKIIIKNLPFEATRKDLLELFGAFGQLKSVRVPKKFDQSARGFAFVEFNLMKEAETAMSQLEGVHLLGRRLVMQYAEQDAENAEVEIERMTKKVKKQVATQNLAAARLAGKGKIELEEKDEEDFD